MADVTTPRQDEQGLPPHEHLHLFDDGLRRFEHDHPYPVSEADRLATRAHGHRNGWHSHPHGHARYAPLPPGIVRRAIIPVLS